MKVIERLMNAGLWFLLEAGPGCAKTARIRQAADAVGRKMFYGIGGRTSDLLDRLDAAGAVVPNLTTMRSMVLPLDDLAVIFECDAPAVWFLDEIGRALLEVQGALCSQMDRIRREKPNIMVVAATNRPQDRAGVSALSGQLVTRFDAAYAIAEPDLSESPSGAVFLNPWTCGTATCGNCEVCGWVEWALDSGMPAEQVAWIRSTSGRTLYNVKPNASPAVRQADYRSNERFGRAWQAGFTDLQTLAAIIGKPVAAEMLAYFNLASDIATPEQVKLDPLGAPVPQSDQTAALYLVSTMLAAAVDPSWVPQFVTYMERLPRVYAALTGRDAYRRLGGKLAGTKEWVRWFTANQDLFNTSGTK